MREQARPPLKEKYTKVVKGVLRFLLLLIPRLCIPVSFLLAIVFGPILMLSAVNEWPKMLLDAWHDPL